LGTTLTNQSDIHNEIKGRLNSGNACYYSVQNLLSSRLISKNLKIKLHKTVTFPVVLCGCETWSVTLRGKHRLRDFEYSVLRRICGPKSEEDGSWRKLHNDELHSLYSSRRMRWEAYVAPTGEGRDIYRVLVGRPEGKRPLGKPRRRWEENIKWTLGRQGSMGRTGFGWLRIESSGGLL
jgi:hypothetical protein